MSQWLQQGGSEVRSKKDERGVAAVAGNGWLVKEAEFLDFRFWLNGALRLNLGAARRSASAF